MKLPAKLTLPTLALSLFALSATPAPAQEEEGGLDLNELLKTGEKLLRENQDEILEAVTQSDRIPKEVQQLANLMVEAQVPRAAYLRLQTQPVEAKELKSIQDSAQRAEEKGSQWAKHAVLSAIRYQDKLRGGEAGGYGAFDLLCEFDSSESPSKATVIIIEDKLLDDSIRGLRWDIVLARDPKSGIWKPTAAGTARLPWQQGE